MPASQPPTTSDSKSREAELAYRRDHPCKRKSGYEICITFAFSHASAAQKAVMNHVAMFAIATRRRLWLAYPNHYLIVEPYAYGLDGDGKALLFCYQVSSSSESDSGSGWRLVKFAEIVAASETGEEFDVNRPDYYGGCIDMQTVLARL